MEKVEGKTAMDPVIDAKFCNSHPMHLILKPKKRFFKSTIFNVLDANESQLFQIVNKDSISKSELVILDANDSPVATLCRKVFSNTWRVYRGKNTQKEDALFSVKRQDGLTLNVFMGFIEGKKKGKGNFDVIGYPPTIYKGDAMIADVNNNFSWGGDESVKKDGFKVRVSTGTDYMFVISLIMIHREMAISNSTGSTTPAVVGGGIEIGGAIASGIGGGDGGGGGGGGGDGGGGGGAC